MQCIKTGAHIYIAQYGEFAICDVFELNGVSLFRIAGTSREPMRDVIHFNVVDVAQWFDRNDTGHFGRSSTMISACAANFGYDGKAVQA